MAPQANIDFVEANLAANNAADVELLSAAQVAGTIPGVSVVSMSWGVWTTNNLYPGDAENAKREELPDAGLPATGAGHTGVTWISASGDNGAGQFGYPDTSPNVLSPSAARR